MRRRDRYWSLGWALGLLLACTGLALAQFASTDTRVTETLTHGKVDWTDGLALSQGSATGATRRGAAVGTGHAAFQAARQSLGRLLGQMRLDATQTLGQAMQAGAVSPQALDGVFEQATIAATQYGAGGAVETTVQLPLAGALTALLLPAGGAQTAPEPTTEAVHTGVVIDARGLAVQPALLPHIIDEQGQPLYTPALVEREAAIQQGYVAYAKAFDQPPLPARIGNQPLVVRALRVTGTARVDVVLSMAEAARLRDYAATRRLVRQCRVLIVI